MVGGNSTSSHPELLDLLAREFAAHNFDLKFLIRAITATPGLPADQRRHASRARTIATLFARMPLRGLTGEQLFDSVAMATGYRDSGGGDDLLSGLLRRQSLGPLRVPRPSSLPSERPTEAQTSILQALSLMNGKVIAAATSLEKSETLAAVVDAPFLEHAERVETLYLATLSRKPEAKEIDRAVKFVEDAVEPSKDEQARKRPTATRWPTCSGRCSTARNSF